MSAQLQEAMRNLRDAYVDAKTDPCEITLDEYEEAIQELNIVMESCYADLEQLSAIYEHEDINE